ncbi:MAG: glycoside hydrolase [bacterium]|nr:glycoside hydrolase [bacterium]
MVKSTWAGVLATSLIASTIASSAVAQAPASATPIDPGHNIAAVNTRVEQDGEVVHLLTYGSFGVIRYYRSQDGGLTWAGPRVIGGQQYSAYDFSFDGARAVIAAISAVGVQVWASSDRGQTWTGPQLVAAQIPFHTSEARVHIDGSTVSVMWAEHLGNRMWANHSLDGGLTWNPNPTRIDTGLATGIPSRLTKIAAGTDVHLFWDHNGNTLQQRSTDGGLTWLSTPRVVSPLRHRYLAGHPSNLIVVLPHLHPQVQPQILRSVDGGVTWSQVLGTGMTVVQGLAVDGQTVVLSGATGGFPAYRVEINVSQDGGQTWLPNPWTLTTPTLLGSALPAVGGDAQYVRLDWLGPAGGSQGVLQSVDYGTNWRLIEGPADVAFFPGSDRNLAIAEDFYNSFPIDDYFVYVHSGHTSHGQGTPGSGGITPFLRGAGNVYPGTSFALELSDAPANALGAFAVGFRIPVDLPFGAAILHVLRPIGPFVFTTSTGGDATLPVAIPPTMSFAGLPMTSQAFVIDPGAAGGFSSTRAVVTWLR